MNNERQEKETPDNGAHQQDPFESALRRSLRPVNPPDKLAAFLALAAEAEERRAAKGPGPRLLKLSNSGRVIAFPRTKLWITGSIAAALAVGAFVGESIHQRREQQRVQQQFAEAMRVTDRALDHTRAQLARAGIAFTD